MNKLRRTCAVTILTAALATSAFAGIMDSPGVAAPPPPPPSETSTTSTNSTSDSTTDITTTIILTIVGLIPVP